MNLHLNFVENKSHFSIVHKSNLIHLIQPIKQSFNHCHLYTEINLMLYHPLVYIIIQTSIPAINIIKLNITHCCSSLILPRLLTTTILFDLLQSIRYDANKTSNTPSDIYISKYNEIRSLYPQHIPIFTDG